MAKRTKKTDTPGTRPVAAPQSGAVKEQSGPQVPGKPMVFGRRTSAAETLIRSTTASYATYREMRKHPTIALARMMSMAPILSGAWNVAAEDDAPEGAADFIEELVPMREQVMEAALCGGIDFGFSAFEKVFESDGQRVYLKKLKPLIPDNLTILVQEDTGAFLGFSQEGRKLDLEYSLLIPFRVEGTQWHGYPAMENNRTTYEQWKRASNGADKYDTKVAGSHFVVYYPPGKTEYDGVLTDNFEIAKSFLDSLEGSGSITIPTTAEQWMDALNDVSKTPAWRIEILEDKGGRQPEFVNRLDYLDKQLVRGLYMPERSLLEGTHGTKAEAESHGATYLTYAEHLDRHVTRHINWHLVDQLLSQNWGDEARGTVALEPAPLADAALSYIRDLTRELVRNPSGFAEVFPWLDVKGLLDRTEVPRNDVEAEGVGVPPSAPEDIAALAGMDPFTSEDTNDG